MSLDAAVLVYAVLHVLRYCVDVRNNKFPRRMSLVLVGLGVWAGWRLVG